MTKCYLALPLPTSLNKLYTSQYSGGRFTGAKILSKEGKKNRYDIMVNVERQMSEECNLDWDIEYTREHYIYMDIVAYVTRQNVDLDNTLKSLNDSIEESGLVFLNDKKVVPRFSRVYVDASNPRVEITFSQTGWKGIMDSEQMFNDFVNKCSTCTSYRNGSCSILKKTTKENKIVPEVVLNRNTTPTCLKYKEKK